MTRRDVVASVILSLGAFTRAFAQAPNQIGILFPGQFGQERLALIKEGLSRTAATNVTITVANAGGDAGKLKVLADAFIKEQVDTILAIGSGPLRAAAAASSRVPIVALDLETDPVKAGLVASLSRPGGNVTGIFFDAPEIAGKWLELLRDVVPALSTVGLLYDENTDDAQMRAAEAAAARFSVRTARLPISAPQQIGSVVEQASAAGLGAILIHSSPLFVDHAAAISETALRHRMPSIGLFPINARTGALLAYGPDNFALMRDAGEMVGRVLSGSAVAELPVYRPTRFKLVINMTTAKRLGLTIPASTLTFADEITE